MNSVPPPPASLPECVAAGPTDAPRIATWQLLGWLYGTLHGPWRGRVISGFFAVAGAPLLPLLVAITAVQIVLPRTRMYLDPDRTAVLGITATRTGWRLENHATSRPGTGAGKRLRALLAPALLEAADQCSVALYPDASAPALADAYAGQFPGFQDMGPALLRGRRMHREARRP